MPAIHKALITAAGPRQNTLPLQRLVDRDGVEKSALQMIIEEVLAAVRPPVAVGRGGGRRGTVGHLSIVVAMVRHSENNGSPAEWNTLRRYSGAIAAPRALV